MGKIMAASIFLYEKSVSECRMHTDLCLFLGTPDQMKKPHPFSLEQSKFFFSLPSPGHKAVTLSCQSLSQILSGFSPCLPLSH